MSLIWMDGFDTYGTSGSIKAALESSLYVHGEVNVSNSTRTGRGYCIVMPWNSSVGSPVYIRKAFDVKDELIVGFAWRVAAIQELKEICRFQYDDHFGNVRSHIAVYMAADGAVTIANVADDGSTWVKMADSGPNKLFPSVWHFIEIKVSFHATTGTVQVRIDNQTCLEATGRTRNPLAPALCNLWRASNFQLEDASFNDTSLDDLYILDTEGTEFNTFLGDVVVHGLLPNEDGTLNQLSQFGGSLAKYTAVDDIPADGDTSYVFGNTVGQQERYFVDDLPSNVINVLAVSVHARAKKDAAGASQLKLLCKLDADIDLGPAEPITTQYITRALMLETAPDGGAWTKAKVEDMEIGFEVA